MNRLLPFLLAAAVLAAAAVSIWQAAGPTVVMRHAAFDIMQRLAPRPADGGRVVIIDIDEESQRRLGSWPWPRDRVAELVTRLRAGNPAAIAFDIAFTEPDPTSPSQSLSRLTDMALVQDLARRLPDHDRLLADAMAGAPVVTAFGLLERPTRFAERAPATKAEIAAPPAAASAAIAGYQGAHPTLAALEAAAAGNGTATINADEDGVVRRLPLLARLGERLYPSLAAEALRVAAGADAYRVTAAPREGLAAEILPPATTRLDAGPLSWPINRDGTVFLHFAPADSVRSLSAWRILDGTADPAQLAGAIAILGSTSPDVGDHAALPTGGLAPKIAIQAQAVAQLMDAGQLTRPAWLTPLEMAVTVVVGLALAAIALLWGLRPAAGLWLLAMAGAGAGWWYGFTGLHLVVDPLSPALAITAAFAIAGIARFRDESEERERIRAAFAARVPAETLQRLLASPELVPYDGETRVCSFVHVCDPGFPQLLRNLEPEAVFGLLADYTEGMAAIAFRHEGMLGNNSEGAVTALFSAPLEQDDHARAAVACAHEMEAYAVRFATRVREDGGTLRDPAIGIDSGTMVLGGTGGDALLDNLVFGEPLTTAAILASAAGRIGTAMCISGRTVGLCPAFTGRPIGRLASSEGESALEMFEPLDASLMSDPAIRAYDAAYDLLSRGDPGATAAFRKLVETKPDDSLARYHLQRLSSGATGTVVNVAK